jgi:nucleotide-binding universal stress UspA family protein
LAQSEDTVESATGFGRIVCAVDPLAPSVAAARQAVMLAAPSTELIFMAVLERPRGEDQSDGVDAALEAATQLAAERGITAASRAITSDNAPEALIDSSAGADLLVVGAGSRKVLIGSTASAALHAAPLPVLIARSAGEARDFPEHVLVATDGSPEARRGSELAARIAGAHRSHVVLIQVADGRLEAGRTLDEEAAAVAQQIGVEPALLETYGDPAERISEAARHEGASLIVIGSRGLGRARVLGSVGERVAHEAPCSVLVLRETAP